MGAWKPVDVYGHRGVDSDAGSTWAVVVGVALLAGVVGVARATTEEDLLARFAPVVWAEDEGYYGDPWRSDFPYDMLTPGTGSSIDVEDNFETFPSSWATERYTVYGHAEELTDSRQTTYWLLQYFYYLPGDYDRRITGSHPIGMKHEHDWEWVCVFVGHSNDSYASDGLAPFIAVLSGHKEDNVELMEDPAEHVYLFPYVTVATKWLEDNDGSFIEPENRLSFVGDNYYGERACVSMLSTGNEFSPCIVGSVLDGEPRIVTSGPTSWTTEEYDEGDLCVDRTSDATMAFGDPGAWWVTFLGGGGQDECQDPREVPWKRARTWGGDAVPSGFIFPGADAFTLESKPETESGAVANGRLRLSVTPSVIRAGCTIRARDYFGAVVLRSVDGRALRVVGLTDGRRGSGEAYWDGTDSRGVRLTSGVYFLGAPGRGSRVERVIVLN